MGTLHLVRHGQASFGAANYDQLSALGTRQCHRLGEYFRERGITFDAVLCGTLVRHRQSLAALTEGLGGSPEALPWPGLNEYDSEAVIRTVHPEPLTPATTPEQYRSHFRLLRDGLRLWMRGAAQPQGMPTYPDFVAGVVAALDHVRARHHGQRVLIVSSGGPISTAVGQVLATPGRDHHRAEPAHPQQRSHGVRLHAQTPHAGDVQHAATSRCAGAAGLGHLRLIAWPEITQD